MPLPVLTLPAGVPPLRAAGQAFTPDSVYAHFTTRTGHARKRRRYTAADAMVAVSWTNLSNAHMALVDAWVEDQLEAGNLHFAAQLVNLGPGTVRYEAQWAAPYQAVPSSGRWEVSGTLWLFGDPVAVPP